MFGRGPHCETNRIPSPHTVALPTPPDRYMIDTLQSNWPSIAQRQKADLPCDSRTAPQIHNGKKMPLAHAANTLLF